MTSPSTLDSRGDTDQSTPAPLFICPYCGGPTPDQPRCASCRGFLDPLSRQASQNAMGPWFIRDDSGAGPGPFRPGCSYATLAELVRRKKVTFETILRGPTTNQFWMPARRVPGLAHLLGVCHACKADVDGVEHECPECTASFEHPADRQNLGLLPVMLLPGQGSPEAVAASTMSASSHATHAAPAKAAPVLNDQPSQAILRHVGLIESRLRWAWTLFIAVLVLFTATIAIAAAAIFAGLVDVTIPSATSTESPTPVASPPADTQIPPPAASPSKPTPPAAAPSTDSAPSAPSPQATEPPSVAPQADPQSVESQARKLLAQDTTDSLSQAETLLEEAVKADPKATGLADLLAAVRARKAQHAVKGIR